MSHLNPKEEAPELTPKEIIVQEIQTNLAQSPTVVAWDFRYLDNETIFQLKKNLAQFQVSFKVYKNSLISRVLPNHLFQQPTALIFGPPRTLPKILSLLDQFQPPRSPIKRFKVAWEENKLIEAPLLEKWAKLPSQEVLISNLCFSLQWPLRRLISVLEKIPDSQKNSQKGSTTTENNNIK